MLTHSRTDPVTHHLRRLFSAKAARTGGIVRRSVAWVDREIGQERLACAVRGRGYRMIRCGGQFVIICNDAKIEVIC